MKCYCPSLFLYKVVSFCLMMIDRSLFLDTDPILLFLYFVIVIVSVYTRIFFNLNVTRHTVGALDCSPRPELNV